MDGIFDQIASALSRAKNAVVFAHAGPDGDTLGSATALAESLRATFPGKAVTVACADGVPEAFSFLPGAAAVTRDPDLSAADMAVFCDVPDARLSGFEEKYPWLFSGAAPFPVASLDHHRTNTGFAPLNAVDPERPSASLVVFDFLRRAGWEIPPAAATAMLCGVYTDTGSFLHQNADSGTFSAAAALVGLGAEPEKIVRSVFCANSDDYLRKVGTLLRRARVSPSGVAWCCIYRDDVPEGFRGYDALKSQVVSLINSVRGVRYSCVLIERGDGTIKGSLRTLRDDLDMTEMAGRFGGGGHRRASGFTLRGAFSKRGEEPEIALADGSVLRVG